MKCQRFAITQNNGFTTRQRMEIYILKDIFQFTIPNIGYGMKHMKPLNRVLLKVKQMEI